MWRGPVRVRTSCDPRHVTLYAGLPAERTTVLDKLHGCPMLDDVGAAVVARPPQ
jgi:hypothetical protein